MTNLHTLDGLWDRDGSGVALERGKWLVEVRDGKLFDAETGFEAVTPVPTSRLFAGWGPALDGQPVYHIGSFHTTEATLKRIGLL